MLGIMRSGVGLESGKLEFRSSSGPETSAYRPRSPLLFGKLSTKCVNLGYVYVSVKLASATSPLLNSPNKNLIGKNRYSWHAMTAI